MHYDGQHSITIAFSKVLMSLKEREYFSFGIYRKDPHIQTIDPRPRILLVNDGVRHGAPMGGICALG